MIRDNRVVFDCNTLLQALASPNGPAGKCFQLVLHDEVQLFISATVVNELRDVASRPKVIRKLRLTLERVEAFLESVEVHATLLADFPEPFIYERDPDDAHYINLALAANAKLIVSRDKDLLDLMDQTRRENTAFRARFPAIQILTPTGFLNYLASGANSN